MSCLNCGGAWSKCLTLFKIHCSVLHCRLGWAPRLQRWADRLYIFYSDPGIAELPSSCCPSPTFCHLPIASKYLTSYNGIASRVNPVTTVDIGAPSKINLFWLLMCMNSLWTISSINADKGEYIPFTPIIRIWLLHSYYCRLRCKYFSISITSQ